MLDRKPTREDILVGAGVGIVLAAYWPAVVVWIAVRPTVGFIADAVLVRYWPDDRS